MFKKGFKSVSLKLVLDLYKHSCTAPRKAALSEAFSRRDSTRTTPVTSSGGTWINPGATHRCLAGADPRLPSRSGSNRSVPAKLRCDRLQQPRNGGRCTPLSREPRVINARRWSRASCLCQSLLSQSVGLCLCLWWVSDWPFLAASAGGE